MISSCDSETVTVFKTLVGKQLIQVLARPYPNYMAYSELILKFSHNLSVVLRLQEREIAPKFEVFVVEAAVAENANAYDVKAWDHFSFSDFLVSDVCLLRRNEWLEPEQTSTLHTEGNCGLIQYFGEVTSGPTDSAVMVDSGVCFVDDRGTTLGIQSDTFPLVFQLQFSMGASNIPTGQRISVFEHKFI